MPILYGEGRESAFSRLGKEIVGIEQWSRTSQYKNWSQETSLTSDREMREDLLTDTHHISTTNKTKIEIDEILDIDSDSGTDIDSPFLNGGISTSSASTASLNPVQTIGIRKVSRALLRKDDLKALYVMAVRNVERRKARAYIRGFLKEYGQNPLKEASKRSLEIQAAKFVQELAGRIADEISWSINGFQEMGRLLKTRLEKKGCEVLQFSIAMTTS